MWTRATAGLVDSDATLTIEAYQKFCTDPSWSLMKCDASPNGYFLSTGACVCQGLGVVFYSSAGQQVGQRFEGDGQMPKYTAEIEHIARLDDDKDSPIMAVTVSVYGDLPNHKVSPRTRNAILRAAQKVVKVYGVSAMDWEEILYRQGVNNGQERHTVVFEPNVAHLV